MRRLIGPAATPVSLLGIAPKSLMTGASLVVLGLVVSAGCSPAGGAPPRQGTGSPSSAVGASSPSADATSPPPTSATASLPPDVTVSIAAPGAPLGIGFGFGSVWVSSHRGQTLYRIDPTTNTVAAAIDVGSTACGDIGIGEGQVWLLTCPAGRTLRIDPGTNQIVGVAPVPGGAMPGFGAGSVWFGSGFGPGGELVRADPHTDRVQAEIRVGATPAYVISAFDAIWVSNFDDATVSRVDPQTNDVIATIPVGPPGGQGSGYMAVAADSLWVANTADGNLYRIDPRDNMSEPIDIDAKPLTEFFDLFVGEGLGSVWVRTHDHVVSRIDPESERIVETYPAGSGGGDVGAFEDSLWIANFGDDTVWRVPID